MSNKRFEMYEIRRVLAQMRLGPRTGRSPSPGSWGERISPGSGNWPMRKGFLTGGRSLPDDIGLARVFGAPWSRPAVESSVLPWPDLILAWHRDKISGQAIYAALVRNHGTQGMQSRVGRFWEVPGRRGQGRIGHDHAGLRSRGGGPSRLRAGAAASRPEVGQMASIRIFVMTLCFSRTQYAKTVFDQTSWTWCGLHRRAFEFLGGRGRGGHHRHLTCASRKACDYDPEVRRSFRESAEG